MRIDFDALSVVVEIHRRRNFTHCEAETAVGGLAEVVPSAFPFEVFVARKVRGSLDRNRSVLFLV